MCGDVIIQIRLKFISLTSSNTFHWIFALNTCSAVTYFCEIIRHEFRILYLVFISTCWIMIVVTSVSYRVCVSLCTLYTIPYRYIERFINAMWIATWQSSPATSFPPSSFRSTECGGAAQILAIIHKSWQIFPLFG